MEHDCTVKQGTEQKVTCHPSVPKEKQSQINLMILNSQQTTSSVENVVRFELLHPCKIGTWS